MRALVLTLALAAPVCAEPMVPTFTEETASFPIFRHTGRDAEMVTAELAGDFEAPLYGMLAVADQIEAAQVAMAAVAAKMLAHIDEQVSRSATSTTRCASESAFTGLYVPSLSALPGDLPHPKPRRKPKKNSTAAS